MQYVIFGNFNEEFSKMPADQQKNGMQSEWAKSREYYSKGLLRQIWLFAAEHGIMSVFEVDTREHMEKLLADYPGVKAGWVTASIREAAPYHGFFPEFS